MHHLCETFEKYWIQSHKCKDCFRKLMCEYRSFAALLLLGGKTTVWSLLVIHVCSYLPEKYLSTFKDLL